MDKFKNSDHKAAVTVLRDSFVPEFVKDENTKDSPLAKILSTHPQNFYKATPSFLAVLDKADVDYSSKDFWKKIFTGK